MSVVFKHFITWVGKVKPEDVKAQSGQKMYESVLKVTDQFEKEVRLLDPLRLPIALSDQL